MPVYELDQSVKPQYRVAIRSLGSLPYPWVEERRKILSEAALGRQVDLAPDLLELGGATQGARVLSEQAVLKADIDLDYGRLIAEKGTVLYGEAINRDAKIREHFRYKAVSQLRRGIYEPKAKEHLYAIGRDGFVHEVRYRVGRRFEVGDRKKLIAESDYKDEGMGIVLQEDQVLMANSVPNVYGGRYEMRTVFNSQEINDDPVVAEHFHFVDSK